MCLEQQGATVVSVSLPNMADVSFSVSHVDLLSGCTW